MNRYEELATKVCVQSFNRNMNGGMTMTYSDQFMDNGYVRITVHSYFGEKSFVVECSDKISIFDRTLKEMLCFSGIIKSCVYCTITKNYDCIYYKENNCIQCDRYAKYLEDMEEEINDNKRSNGAR